MKCISSSALVASLVLASTACAQNPPASGEVLIQRPGCPTECAIRVEAPPGNDIRNLIRQVANDTGMRFVIDPRVNARVEIAGASLESINYEMLLAILRIHGFAVVATGGELTVIQEPNARAMPTRVLQTDDPSVSDHEVVSRVIPVGDRAQELVPILRPLIPQFGHLAAAAGNLVIVDRYDNVRRITALVNEIIE